ncbi:TetR family transcriptional regulator [Paraburkholderia sp. 22B1P]|uniref:TetR/AcrR family transcriptional regulator n=1 Tax=Paraburkholderia sp. 22B1P TaxID=3080498 RepID=UPI00308B3486|nr:TetR family transcriptional regulator [Paraburkholderia sp. 22B1P]
MRKSRQEAAETRRRIVDAASSEFRSKGIDGAGLSDLMGAAGLTHGGFYKHFDSKEQLVEESLTLAMGKFIESVEAELATGSGERGLDAAIDDYLSAKHRDNLSGGCPFVALGSELVRSSDSVRQVTTEGFLKLVDAVATRLQDKTPAAARKEALFVLSSMIGALTMARVVTDADLSASILREARKRLVR